jgi:para-aminobenzoate synthetase component 1
MWSDGLETAARQALVRQLRQVLPAPRPEARSEAIELGWRRETAEVAAALQQQPGLMWLDQPRARLFSDPLATISVSDRCASIQGPCGTIQWDGGGIDVIEAALQAWGGPPDAMLCGYLGYELGLELEDVAPPRRAPADLPDLYLALYDSWLEHSAGQWRFHSTDAWRRVSVKDMEVVQPGRDEDFGEGAISSTPGAEGFCEAVARAVERIYQGELFQVNLCRRLGTALEAPQIWPFYQRLRAISPAAYGALLDLGGGRAVLSASPELFLSVERGHVRSCPIKGTRPRGASMEEDRELVRALRESEKDRAELAMIVDVTRNDLGRVCRAGSVAVTRHAELMTLPTVHHTYSEVTAVLREDRGAADLLRACFPPASITGAPKIRAMQVAAEEEGCRRGPAMGAIGWISMGGDLELSVAIRTAAASEGRVRYLAGCGITAESVPAEELEESEAKAAAFRQARAGSTTAARESIRS